MRRSVQRYICTICKHQFQSARRPHKRYAALLDEYVHGRQTLPRLARKTGRSVRWVRERLYLVPQTPIVIEPQPSVFITDTTFWGENYGVTVFRSPTLKKNLWWTEVTSERVVTYYYGRKILEGQGWTFTAAVVDGRRGLARVFQDIPVQICIFHQVKTVTRYLTRRPQTLAGQELRMIVLCLKNSTENEFTILLTEWYARWNNCINEKTYLIGCKRWFYTHKNVRSAYMSLQRNLPYLFTYQKQPDLHIPSTTNSLDGMFTQLKNKLGAHRGLRKDRRYRIISEILAR